MIAASFRRFTLGASVGRRKMYDFYNVPSPAVRGALVKGTIAEHTIDLRESNPGDIINVPYEFTVHGSFRDFWQSGMYSYDRICTSSPFARSLGMQDQILPFNLMLYLTGSMSHANHAKLQLGFRNAVYHWPGFQGDTFQKRFIIKSLKTTSCGKNSTVNITCEMVNQNNALVFACEKSMLFPFAVPPSQQQQEPRDVTLGGDSKNPFLDYLIDKAPLLQQRGSQSLSVVRPGQLILHTLARPMTATHMMQLATLARLTHDRHFNTHKYAPEELLVPGGLVLGLTCSLTARDLHEVSLLWSDCIPGMGLLNR